MTVLSAILGVLAVLFLVPVTVLLVQVPMALPPIGPGSCRKGSSFLDGRFYSCTLMRWLWLPQPSVPFSLNMAREIDDWWLQTIAQTRPRPLPASVARRR